MGRSRGLGWGRHWHSAAETEEMWLKHNSIWGRRQAETSFILYLLKKYLLLLRGGGGESVN